MIFAMSYNRRRHIKNKIRKIRPKKSIFKRPIFWYLILFLILISVVFYFLLFSPNFQVKNIIISGNEKTSLEGIKNIVENNVNKKIISFLDWTLESGSIFLVRPEKVEKDILEKFPIIEKIKIDKNLPQTLMLSIIERKPLGVFCDSKITDNQQCFLIDENGVIFELLAAVPNGYPIVRQILNQPQLFVGEDLIEKNIMNIISKVKKNLKDNFQIDIEEAFITSPLRLDVKTSENWQIYFNLDADSDINLQLTKLNLLLSVKISPETRKNLQYIDLRFDRAYYK